MQVATASSRRCGSRSAMKSSTRPAASRTLIVSIQSFRLLSFGVTTFAAASAYSRAWHWSRMKITFCPGKAPRRRFESKTPVGQHHQFLGREQDGRRVPRAGPHSPSSRTSAGRRGPTSRWRPDPERRTPQPRDSEPAADTPILREHAVMLADDGKMLRRRLVRQSLQIRHRIRMAELRVLSLDCHDALVCSRPDARCRRSRGFGNRPRGQSMLNRAAHDCNPRNAEIERGAKTKNRLHQKLEKRSTAKRCN